MPVEDGGGRADARALESFKADRLAGRVGATTAVFDAAGRALYFSKEVLPFTGRALAEGETCPVFHHVGVYAYRADALARYPSLAPGVVLVPAEAAATGTGPGRGGR